MDRIARLKNPIREYAWGSRTAIPELLGLAIPSDKPRAELWLGAHPKAPSLVRVDGCWVPLDQVIESDPVSVLGKAASDRFSKRLPFLFKVLAADRPLSIQVHPNLEQAREGFERENRLGIPLDAGERNYPDANHKPELLCAVTPFEALKGFRAPQDLLARLTRVCRETLPHQLDQLKKTPNSAGIRSLLTSLLTMGAGRKQRIVDAAVQAAGSLVESDRAYQWVTALDRAYPGDMGVLSPLIFNLVTLEPGEGIYIRAGEPHAYLKGVGMELMANSDNVLRGGLTPKHVDVQELLRIVDVNPSPVHRVLAQPGAPAEMVYRTPAHEFQLCVIRVSSHTSFVSGSDRSVEVVICMEGEADIRDLRKGDSQSLKKGESAIIPAAVGSYEMTGRAILYRAAVGGPF
jgi:mannose-6-phosphate isomerase